MPADSAARGVSVRTRFGALLTRDRTAVYPWFILVGFLVGWLAVVALGRGGADVNGNVVGNDFIAFYSGAKLVVADGSANPYLLSAIGPVEHAAAPGMSAQLTVPYLNPPVAMLWFWALPLLPYGWSLLAWSGLGLLAWAGAHGLILRSDPRLGGWGLWRLCLGSLLFSPTLMWLMYGQASGFVLLILAATYWLLVQRREVAAGAVLGLLAFKPNLALGFGLILLVSWRWRALLAGAVSLGAQLGLAAWLWPVQTAQFAAVRGEIVRVIIDPAYKVWGVQSVYAFWHLLVGALSPLLADVLTGLTSLAVLGALAYLWWRAPWEPQSDRWRWRVAGTLLLTLPLGLQLFFYDLSLLVLPFWIVVGLVAARPGTDPALDAGPVLQWVALLWVLALFGPYLSQGQLALGGALGLPRVAVQLLVPALLAAGCWLLWRGAGVDGEVEQGA